MRSRFLPYFWVSMMGLPSTVITLRRVWTYSMIGLSMMQTRAFSFCSRVSFG